MQRLKITKDTTFEDVKIEQVIKTTGDLYSFFEKDCSAENRKGLQIFMVRSPEQTLNNIFGYLHAIRSSFGPIGYEKGLQYLIFFKDFQNVLQLTDEKIKELCGDKIIESKVYGKIEKILKDTNISFII